MFSDNGRSKMAGLERGVAEAPDKWSEAVEDVNRKMIQIPIGIARIMRENSCAAEHSSSVARGIATRFPCMHSGQMTLNKLVGRPSGATELFLAEPLVIDGDRSRESRGRGSKPPLIEDAQSSVPFLKEMGVSRRSHPLSILSVRGWAKGERRLFSPCQRLPARRPAHAKRSLCCFGEG